jgi:hypothetical protein
VDVLAHGILCQAEIVGGFAGAHHRVIFYLRCHSHVPNDSCCRYNLQAKEMPGEVELSGLRSLPNRLTTARLSRLLRNCLAFFRPANQAKNRQVEDSPIETGGTVCLRRRVCQKIGSYFKEGCTWKNHVLDAVYICPAGHSHGPTHGFRAALSTPSAAGEIKRDCPAAPALNSPVRKILSALTFSGRSN